MNWNVSMPLLLRFENNFTSNIRKFRKYFGNDFGIIAGDKPGKFLI